MKRSKLFLSYIIMLISSAFIMIHALEQKPNHENKLAVLSIFMSDVIGGAEVCALTLHELLHVDGYNACMIVSKNSPLHAHLKKRQLPYVTTHFSSKDPEPFVKKIRTLCQTKKIDIVQCHTPLQVRLAQQAVKDLQTKVVLMFHGLDSIDFKRMEGLDGVVTVNPRNEPLIHQANADLKLGIKKIIQVYPFFDEQRFLDYKALPQTRSSFLKKLGLDEQRKIPILCMVANFYGKSKSKPENAFFRKNQELLLRALRVLVFEKNRPAYLVFLGDGTNRLWHENLCHQLGLNDFVYFAGFRKNVEYFLHHSDIHVLTSVKEPLGIVYLEASLMRKPSVGATGTGADFTIIDGSTGFIFKNNDLNDLVQKLEKLINNKKLRCDMGVNAYNFVTGKKSFNRTFQDFLTYAKFEKFKKFYTDLML